MQNKKILTIQDISCYGQCSITVALPILSAFGFETAILPSAILSTHTSGFKNFTVHDLSDEIPLIVNHWKNEGIKYDVLYSAYLGEVRHIDIVLGIKKELLKDDALFLVDPVMGDNGKLYPAFNNDYVIAMRKLVKEADIIKFTSEELELLSRQKDVLNGLKTLLKPNQVAIITLGKDGSIFYSKDKYIKVPSYPLKPVDTTGAGDAFYSYFLYGIDKGLDMDDDNQIINILKRANVTGGLATQKKGAIGVAPTNEEIDLFLSKLDSQPRR